MDRPLRLLFRAQQGSEFAAAENKIATWFGLAEIGVITPLPYECLLPEDTPKGRVCLSRATEETKEVCATVEFQAPLSGPGQYSLSQPPLTRSEEGGFCGPLLP